MPDFLGGEMDLCVSSSIIPAGGTTTTLLCVLTDDIESSGLLPKGEERPGEPGTSWPVLSTKVISPFCPFWPALRPDAGFEFV